VPQAIRSWNYFRSIPGSNLCDHDRLPERYRQTDRQTDGRLSVA